MKQAKLYLHMFPNGNARETVGKLKNGLRTDVGLNGMAKFWFVMNLTGATLPDNKYSEFISDIFLIGQSLEAKGGAVLLVADGHLDEFLEQARIKQIYKTLSSLDEVKSYLDTVGNEEPMSDSLAETLASYDISVGYTR